MNRKLLSLVLVMLITLSFVVGCGKTDSQTAAKNDSATAEKIKVTLLGAQFGDKSYWDSSKKGIETAGKV